MSDKVKFTYDWIKKGIELCISNRCMGSALVLIYSGIDAMAYLNRPENQSDVAPQDFIGWVETYINPQKHFNVSGEELYSARCAVVHSYGIESTKTRLGRARKIGYMFGQGKKVIYDPEVREDFLLVDINSLADAFFDGADQFFRDAFVSPRGKLIEKRLGSLFTLYAN